MRRIRGFVPTPLRRSVHAILRLILPARGIRRQRGDPTSFGTVIDERLVRLHANLPPDVARFQADIYTKDGQRRLGERLGLPMPKVYVTGVRLDEALAHVEEHGLERFVVKPLSSHNAIGCRALVQTERGYLDLRSGQRRSLAGHRRAMARAYARLRRPDAWLLEELLLPFDGTLRAVDDYKFLCLGARAELILHTRPHRRGKRIKQFYDREWQPVNVGLDDRKSFLYEAPVHGQKLLGLAEEAASRLAYPFMRIDTYDTTRGIALGEFTPGIGRRHSFNAHWNEYLLRRWREAEAELLEGIRSGAIALLGPEPVEGAVACNELPGTCQ